MILSFITLKLKKKYFIYDIQDGEFHVENVETGVTYAIDEKDLDGFELSSPPNEEDNIKHIATRILILKNKGQYIGIYFDNGEIDWDWHKTELQKAKELLEIHSVDELNRIFNILE